MPENYQPGARKKVYGQNHKFSDERYAWITVETGKYVILVGKDEGHGSDVVLHMPRPGKIPDLAIPLTNLTIQELDELQAMFNTAFEWARPVVQQRDKEAEDAWNEGDDSHSRNYRPLPTVVYRKRPVGEHGESVRERPEGVPAGGRGGHGFLTRVRGAGAGVAEHDPSEGSAPDDDEATDEP